MGTAALCRIVAGGLVMLVGAALSIGGIQLWRGGPKVWPDIIANETIVQRTSGGMIFMAVLMLITGIAAICNVTWGGSAAAIATMVVVAAAFWVNYLLFGSVRPMHMGTNIVVAAIILALLWVGYAAPAR